MDDKDRPTCSFPGCLRPCQGRKPHCSGHMQQIRQARGDVSVLKSLVFRSSRKVIETGTLCQFPGCDRPAQSHHKGKGPYCQGHLSQLFKHQGDLSALTPLIDYKARADESYRVYLDHLRRFYPSLSEEEIRRKWDIIGIQKVGKISKCSRTKRRRLSMKKNGVWNGRFLARHLMELKEERPLESWEHVDHVDEDPFNDHIDNLQILSKGENSKKNREYHRKIQNWDTRECEDICIISGTPSTRRTHHYRREWRRGHTTYATCNRSCGRIFTNLLRRPGIREAFFIRHFRNNIVGRFMTRSATNEDKRKLRTRELVISKALQDRQDQIKVDFDALVKTHQPHMKVSSDMSPREIRFLQERWKEWGREDWGPFYRTCLTEMLKMTEEERLKFLFRTVLPFDLAHGSEMAWRLFNVL